jgi:hypothetical protein
MATTPRELRKRISKQHKETGRERGWFDKEFVFDYHENREWKETIGPLLPFWLHQSVFGNSYTYDVLDTWTTLRPLQCEVGSLSPFISLSLTLPHSLSLSLTVEPLVRSW